MEPGKHNKKLLKSQVPLLSPYSPSKLSISRLKKKLSRIKSFEIIR